MRKAKWFIAGILMLVLFFFAITLLLPSKVTVTKSIIIDASFQKVNEQISNFSNWKNWFPAFSDKQTQMKLSTLENHPSATMQDKNGHEVVFTIVSSEAGKIDIDIVANKKQSITYQFMIVSNNNPGVQVIWNVNTDLGWYPWKRVQGIMMDKLTGPEYELALQNLRKACGDISVPANP